MEPLPRFTLRCEREDLPKADAEFSDGIQRKVQNRIESNSIETGVRYESVPVPKMFTEHQGDFRAVTWYDESQKAIWICAFGLHDVYDEAKRLFDADRLLPTRDDYVALDSYRLKREKERAAEALQKLRGAVDSTGRVMELVSGSPVIVTRLDRSLYEIELRLEAPLQAVLLLLGVAFPDQVDLEWTTPERNSRGELVRSVIVMVADTF